MVRAAAQDFLHSMRFHVTTSTDIADSMRPEVFGGSNTPAGFMSCTTPEATTEAVEYREGQFNYPMKFPGNTTVSDVTLQKGVVAAASNFWNWMRVVIEGSGNYRCTVTIKHYNRSVLTNKRPTAASASVTSQPTSSAAKDGVASRQYILYEAFPIRHKVAADLDASSSDISVQELDIAYEYFEVLDDFQPVPDVG